MPAAGLEPGAEGLVVLDHFQGNRTPHTDAASRGAITGLTLKHTPAHVFRAIIESICLGTRLIIDVLRSDKRIQPERVIIDHVEEHTIQLVLDAGFWAGMTLYPESKCSPARAIDMLEIYGNARLWLNSACDWGVSIPLNVPYTALEMKRRGWSAEDIDKVVYQNPLKFLSQSKKFKLPKA